jgi:glutamate carboxypeptidase
MIRMWRTLLAAVLLLGAAGLAAANESVKPVLDSAEQRREGAIKLWERLVNIDSGTGDEAGVNAVGGIALEELKKVGAAIETFPSKAPAAGNDIVASFTGTGKGRVLLIAHMDTVFKKGAVAARPFRIERGLAFGPGVSDDKAGIVVALTVLQMLDDLKFKDYARLTLMLNTNEETGSRSSRPLIEKLAREHDVTLNFEGGRPGDGVVIWRKGSATLRVEVKGRSAHAGSAEFGRNAAMELAHQILQLSRLADPAKGTTVNFTVLNAGDRKNVIPDFAAADGDMRALVSEEFDRVEREMAEMSKNRLIPDTEVTTTLSRGFPAMARNAQTDAMAAMAQLIYSEIGRTLKLEGSGGAADSSPSAGVFKPTLDGLSLVGGNPHTVREYAEVDSMVPRLYLLTRMVMELGREPKLARETKGP